MQNKHSIYFSKNIIIIFFFFKFSMIAYSMEIACHFDY